MGKYELVSLHRDSAGMINGAHTFHTWTVWETKLPADTCIFSFSHTPAIHKPQKEQPQSHRTLDSIMCIMHGLICSTKPL